MSKISLGQLDLLALQQYLEIVVGFRKKDDKAIDVQYVGEYAHPTVDDTDDPEAMDSSRVEAYQVAMAALDSFGKAIAAQDKDGNLIPERQTVKNSLMLNGYTDEDFLKLANSETILTDVNQATHNIFDDIRNIKDELYQLKNQLVKTGTIKDSNVYNGFIDCFLEANKKHTINTGVKVLAVSGYRVKVDSLGDLRAEDIVVFEDMNGNFNIQRIEKITNIDEFLIDSQYKGASENFDAAPGTVIKKSLGVSKSGKFIFAKEPKEGVVEGEEAKYIVKDGIERIKVFELDHAGHGFGTEIIIPASLDKNVISKVQVSLAVKGDPGSIIGKFWKYDANNDQYLLTDYYTEPVRPTEASTWFNNFTMKLVSDMPVVPGEKYILILEATSGSDLDKWFIGGFSEEDCLDDVHNDCYIQSNDLLYKSVEDTDMFLVLNTKELIEANIERLNYGLYTCDFDVYQSKANRLRVELCINQEGLFKVTDNNYVNYATRNIEIPIETKNGKVLREKVFKASDEVEAGDIVVIGNEIGEISSVGIANSNIMTKNDMYIANNADVYRVGYELQATVSNKVFEPIANGVIARYKDAETYQLKLVGVVPGRDIIRPEKSSDRLLFECEFTDDNEMNEEERNKLKSFNHVQLQVVWHGNADSNVLQVNEELEGAIFDISASVDQAYSKSNESEGE